ncbi:hypothetical protein [Photorhabdus cinerea]|uniref:Morphogenetic protein n=1 Tax=Photorhabdus cinerea TaxID=471575 RepID=A0A7X5TJJ6_9GAMM|nr:hypothetical protein [Photorhabdus cinerea]NHB94668.1 hypothetical protein [Photorhabdus cinerea]
MTEKPIIFNAEIVRAILSGRKTQTRRIFKHFWATLSWHEVKERVLKLQCPLGKVGDRLWVRETWAHYQTINYRVCANGCSFSEISDGLAAYRADGFESISEMKDHIRLMSECDFECVEFRNEKWIPSIHMPRWASRITLEITDIRVERLNEISEEDAKAEGVTAGICPGHENIMHRVAFRELWESIYGADSFNDNWVWVIEFKRCGE